MSIRIGDKKVGSGAPCFIIAEAGCGHGKSLNSAKKLIDSAVDASSDCVKFQTFTPGEIVSRFAKSASHFSNGDAKKFFDSVVLPENFYQPLLEHCKQNNIMFLSSVFDLPSLDLLEKYNVPAHKIAAFELTDFFLLEAVAGTQKPILLSTGMSSLSQVEQAVTLIEKSGNDQIILMHTVSAYPADPVDYNLKVMKTLKTAFGYPVGISDHTAELEVAVAAVAMGADIIEKHITLDRDGNGPDDPFSLEPAMLKSMVDTVRRVEKMLGDGRKRPVQSEKVISKNMSLALVTKKPMLTGEIITKDTLTIKRSGGGIAPGYFDIIENRKVNCNIVTDSPLQWDFFFERPSS